METKHRVKELQSEKIVACDELCRHLDQYLEKALRLKIVTESLSKDNNLYDNVFTEHYQHYTDFQAVNVPKLVLRELFRAQHAVEYMLGEIRSIDEDIRKEMINAKTP